MEETGWLAAGSVAGSVVAGTVAGGGGAGGGAGALLRSQPPAPAKPIAIEKTAPAARLIITPPSDCDILLIPPIPPAGPIPAPVRTFARAEVYHRKMSRVAPIVPADTDLLCEGCGYTLTGLPEGANCPECGRPVDSSRGWQRSAPAWETDLAPHRRFAAFLRTTAGVTFRTTRFYRHITIRGDVARSRIFAWIHWFIASALFAMTALIHNQVFVRVDVRATFLTLLPDLPTAAALTLAVLLALAALTSLAARLTTWEATYRGIRLPVGVVLRGMHYHAAHYLPVALMALATVVGFRLLHPRGATEYATLKLYLYLLAAEVIIAAGFLFHTYWIAMRNMMYANR